MQLQEIKLYTCEEYEGVKLRDPFKIHTESLVGPPIHVRLLKLAARRIWRLEINFSYCPTNEGHRSKP
jgi:hypothetical protein